MILLQNFTYVIYAQLAVIKYYIAYFYTLIKFKNMLEYYLL